MWTPESVEAFEALGQQSAINLLRGDEVLYMRGQLRALPRQMENNDEYLKWRNQEIANILNRREDT